MTNADTASDRMYTRLMATQARYDHASGRVVPGCFAEVREAAARLARRVHIQSMAYARLVDAGL